VFLTNTYCFRAECCFYIQIVDERVYLKSSPRIGEYPKDQHLGNMFRAKNIGEPPVLEFRYRSLPVLLTSKNKTDHFAYQAMKKKPVI